MRTRGHVDSGIVLSVFKGQITTTVIESWNYRMVRVGRDLKAHLVPTPCHEQEQLPPDQVAQVN